MATHNITINERGRPTPKDMGLIEREDTLSFHAGSAAIVLCLPVEFFGTERIEIAAGDT